MKRRTLIQTAVMSYVVGLPTISIAQRAEPFKIGALLPMSGGGAAFGAGMQRAIQLATEEINAAGGAAGRMLEVTYEDDQTRPEAGVLAAKKLIEVNKVSAVIGTWASSVTLAVMPMTDAANIIEMNTSGAPAISTEDKKDLVWRFQGTTQRTGAAYAEALRKKGAKRVAVMAFNNAAGLGLAEGFRAAWLKSGNKVEAFIVYEPNRPSYRSELQQALAIKPDFIVACSYQPDATILLREWYQSGDKVNWLFPTYAVNDEMVKSLDNQITDGIVTVDSLSNEGSPSYTALAAKYKAATNLDLSGNIFAAMCYDMVMTLGLSIEQAGNNATTLQINSKIRDVVNPPGQKVTGFAEGKALIAKKQKINYEGASSRLDFDMFGDASPDYAEFVINGDKRVRTSIITIL